jgi:AcrR family transcriptional regulator
VAKKGSIDVKATTRSPLTRERVVADALKLVDREGLDALTMRALGRELCCDPMGIYRHFRNKDELVGAVGEALWAEIELPEGRLAGTWQEQFAEAFRIFRNALLSHPNALPVMFAGGQQGPSGLERTEFALEILISGGLSPSDAMSGLNAISCFVVGCVMGQVGGPPEALDETSVEQTMEFYRRLPPTEFPSLAKVMAIREVPSADDTFERGMDLIIRGLETLVPAAGSD